MREIPPEALLSEEVLAAARERAKPEVRTRGLADEPGFDAVANLPNLVALYASQPGETTPESQLPDGGEIHGLLTYTLCGVLNRTSRPSYRELAERIYDAYRQSGRPIPMPFVEGKDLDRDVLGGGGRRRLAVLERNKEGRWTVNAGRLQGLLPNCILAVYRAEDRAGNARPVGHVVAKQCGASESTVEPAEFANLPARDDLPVGGRCQVVYLEYGDMRIAVAVDKEIEKGRDDLQQDLTRIETLLSRTVSEGNALHKVVTKLSDATWAVQARSKGIELLPSSAARIKDDDQIPAGTPRIAIAGADPGGLVLAELARIFRVQNLLSLASAHPRDVVDDRAGADATTTCDVRLVMLKLKDKSDREGTVLDWHNGRPMLVPGDCVAWRIKNHGLAAADVTLLFVDSQLEIEPIYPARDATSPANRLAPGDPILTQVATINAKTLGIEQVVLIASTARGAQPLDFRSLAEPTIDRARGLEGTSRGAGKGPLDSPLGKLLQYAAYGSGSTRGLDLPEIVDSVVSVASWRVVQP